MSSYQNKQQLMKVLYLLEHNE